MSLGSFSSLVNTLSNDESTAILVPVGSNPYLSVPVLAFGSEHDDEAAAATTRMPGLATQYPIGDTSPQSRFVVGIDEALEEYRGSREVTLPGTPDPLHDLWNEDLFSPRPPGQSRALVPDTVAPIEAGNPGALPDARAQAPVPNDQATNERLDDGTGVFPSGPSERIRARLLAMAGFVAGLFLMPSRARMASESRSHRINPGARPSDEH